MRYPVIECLEAADICVSGNYRTDTTIIDEENGPEYEQTILAGGWFKDCKQGRSGLEVFGEESDRCIEYNEHNKYIPSSSRDAIKVFNIND